MLAFQTISAIWRRRWLILGIVVLSIAVTAGVLAKMERSYRSEAVIRLDFAREQPLSVQQQAQSLSVEASAIIESEARVIRSGVIARRVVTRLNLTSEPAFSPHRSLLHRALDLVGINVTQSSVPLTDRIVIELLNNLSVSNDSRSYLITISYVSSDPEIAASVANTFASEYLRSRSEAAISSAQHTSLWLAGQIEEKRAALAHVEKTIPSAAEQIDTTAREADLARLQAQASTIRERLKTLTDSYENVRSLIALKPSAGQLVIQAETGRSPYGPNPWAALGLTFIAAIIAGVALALLLERRAKGFITDSEVYGATGVPCLGALPELNKKSPASKLAYSICVQQIAESSDLEPSVRVPRVAIIGSAVPNEGKTILVSALADFLVGNGCRVLIIDATPRAAGGRTAALPTLETLLGSAEARTQFFSENLGSNCVSVYRYSGLTDSQDTLSTSTFEGFLHEARAHYDRILIKAPPVLLVAEGWLLNASADSFILTTRWNKTPRDAVKAALRRLSLRSTSPTGIVLSGVALKKHKEYFIVDQIYFLRRYLDFYKSVT